MADSRPRLTPSPDLPTERREMLRGSEDPEPPAMGRAVPAALLVGAGLAGSAVNLIGFGFDAIVGAFVATLAAGAGSRHVAQRLRIRRHPASKRRAFAEQHPRDVVDPASLDQQAAALLRRAQHASDTVYTLRPDAGRDRIAAGVVMEQAEWQVACSLREGDDRTEAEEVVAQMEARAAEAERAAAEAARVAQETRTEKLGHAARELKRLDQSGWDQMGGPEASRDELRASEKPD
ncbi:hypothetical protein [Nocardiopsis coralliicola]